jgi:16S rRNA (adenine1518-N6/adenine1519-N6)-dimethyltransferase
MSTGSSRNQTLSFLMRRFQEVGIRPHTKLGQNFLVDLNLVRLLVETAELRPDDVVLEVGTGTGSLTHLLAEKAGAVVTVELDRQLFQLASEELQDLENVVMLQTDALKGKNHVHPLILEEIQKQLLSAAGRQWKLVANLPYNIATPLMMNLLALERPPQCMAVTIQKEVADRIVAQPGVKDYGALSIWVQSQCQVELVRVMPPSVFWPRPKVHSAIVRVTLDESRRGRIGDRGSFHEFIRAMFCHRRKVLRSQLATAFKERLTKADVDEMLRRFQISPDARAEQLDPDTMLRLCEATRPLGQSPGHAEAE